MTDIEAIERIERAIGRGKRRGYETYEEVNGVRYIIEYAIKKESGKYFTYFFMIDESKIDIYEDCATEEVVEFVDLSHALDHLINKGAELSSFGPIKRCLPF